MIVPFAMVTLTATVFIFVPGTQLEGPFGNVFFALGGLLALVFLGCYILALRMVVLELRRSLMDEYSNPSDFPRQYANGILWLPLAHLLVSWIASLIGTPGALSIGFLAMSVFSVVFLIGILPTHRSLDVEQLERALEADEAPAPESAVIQSEEHTEEIVRAIRKFVEEERGYLDEHLTLTSLARSIGYNRTYVSAVLTERLGGFFVYVNRCRLSHADRLQRENPGISVSELIDSSGFSRTTYYKVKKELDK
jgi:AraC-like DNA-binding protein